MRSQDESEGYKTITQQNFKFTHTKKWRKKKITRQQIRSEHCRASNGKQLNLYEDNCYTTTEWIPVGETSIHLTELEKSSDTTGDGIPYKS